MYAGKANIFNVSLAYTLKIALGRNYAVMRIKIVEIMVCIRMLFIPRYPTITLPIK